MAHKPHDEAGRFACKLTPELAKSIVACVSDGLFDAQNALRHGIDVTTLKSWVDRGIDEEAVEPYKSFAEDYIKASIELERETVRIILEAAREWSSRLDSTELMMPAEGGDDYDASDFEAPGRAFRKTKKQTRNMRGDWRAAAWFAERRWPLRWSSTRQPEGGPKEAIKLPDAAVNRRLRVDDMTGNPPPELIKAFRQKGYDLVKLDKP